MNRLGEKTMRLSLRLASFRCASVVGLCVLPSLLPGCGTEASVTESNASSDGDTRSSLALENTPEPAFQPGSDAVAQSHLENDRQRFTLAASTETFARPRSLASRAVERAPVIPRAQTLTFYKEVAGLRADFTKAAANVWLKPDAVDGFTLSTSNDTLSVSVHLQSASSQPATQASGLVVYAGAAPGGGNIIHRVSEQGTEDYVVLERPQQDSSITYNIHLSNDVAGLRLVNDTLELVDNAGTPRLRMSAPAVVDAHGKTERPRVSVQGCAVDTNQSPPWGREPVSPNARDCQVQVAWDEQALGYPLLVDPRWTTTASLSVARTDAEAVTLAGGRVLVVGGQAGDQTTCLASAELFDPTTQTWASVGSLQTGRCSHSGVRRTSTQALVTGGYDSSGTPLASTETFSLLTGVWTPGPLLSGARVAHRSVLLGTGGVLVAGGSSATTETLPAGASAWQPSAPLPVEQYGHTLTTLKDGRVLMIGAGAPLVYTASSNTWAAVTSAPLQDHTGHSATLLNDGRVLVASEGQPSAELFTPSTGVWAAAGSLVSPRTEHTATLLSDGRVLFAGGFTPGLSIDTSVEIFNPSWDTFAVAPELGEPRSGHVAAALPNGDVLIAGGVSVSTSTTLASAEQFAASAHSAVITEYKLPAAIDPSVMDDRATELWAAVARPSSMISGQKYPLLVFLHGNHGTCGRGRQPRVDESCEYTDRGFCPRGTVVTPNHRGYDYIASELASLGYVVVSINANRGITCGGGTTVDSGLNLARGRLILRHLQELSAWNRGVSPTPSTLGFDLQGALDFSQVGIMGHSRGGEGARAAYEQYRDLNSPWPALIVDPVMIRGIFEIGPVDGQTSRVLNADGTAWNVLLPACDGDVSSLEGVRPFDRMLGINSATSGGPKSTYVVWGANHNYFNTEWQTSDSPGCGNHTPLFNVNDGSWGSALQRQVSTRSMYDFFTSSVGQEVLSYRADLFNPQITPNFSSEIDRGYSPGEAAADAFKLEEFNRRAGISSFNVPNEQSRVKVTHGTLFDHDASLRAGTITWTSASATTYFQVNFARAGSGVDLGSYDLLDIRAGRASSPLNTEPTTSVGVQLVNEDGSLSSSVDLQNYVPLNGPPIGAYGDPHTMLPTARIPLSSFTSAHLSTVRGVRFSFIGTQRGVINLANIRATRSTVSSLAIASRGAIPQLVNNTTTPLPAAPIQAGNAVQALRTTTDGAYVEVTLSATNPFPVRDQLATLQLDGVELSRLSYHPAGNLHQIVFRIERSRFDILTSGANLRLRYGAGPEWDFGSLDKSRLNR